MNLSKELKMNSFAFPATLTPDTQEGGYVVTFKDLPEAITQGENLTDALNQAIDCIEESIAGRISDNDIIPQPSPTHEGDYLIHLPAQTAAKAALYNAMHHHHLSTFDLAKRLNCDEKKIYRLLDPHHASQLPSLEMALQALGYRFVIGIVSQS